MHQNERFGRQFGRCEAVAKLAATKLTVQNKQRGGCAINSAASEEFYKILFCFACFAAPARFKSVESEILRRVMKFLCAAHGKILKFYPCAQAAGRDYGALIALPRLLNLRAC